MKDFEQEDSIFKGRSLFSKHSSRQLVEEKEGDLDSRRYLVRTGKLSFLEKYCCSSRATCVDEAMVESQGDKAHAAQRVASLCQRL